MSKAKQPGVANQLKRIPVPIALAVGVFVGIVLSRLIPWTSFTVQSLLFPTADPAHRCTADTRMAQRLCARQVPPDTHTRAAADP